MSYIKDNLLADEKLIYHTKPHWIIFYPSAALIFLSLLSFIVGPYIPQLQTPILQWSFYQITGWLFLITSIYCGIISTLNLHFSEYGITNKRILMKTGFIQRQSLEVFLDKIESIKVSQSLLGRILNYGIIIIIGTGGSHDRFFDIEHPLVFRKKTQETLNTKPQP